MQNELLKTLVGSWAGQCCTWFRPSELADESDVTGSFQLILGDRFLRHSYTGKMQGKPRVGEETIALNSLTNRFQTGWIDDFHMSNGIMFSEGEATDTGFAVVGKYDAALDGPQWGWRTVYELSDSNHLTITAYNITPDGEEARAVETRYVRRET